MGELSTDDDVVELKRVVAKFVARHSRPLLVAWLSACLPQEWEKDQLTPLMLAVKLRRQACVEFLVRECGVDVNVQTTKHKYSALILACYYGVPTLVRVLLDAGCSTTLTNKYGEDARTAGVKQQKDACVSLLDEHASRGSGSDGAGSTPGCCGCGTASLAAGAGAGVGTGPGRAGVAIPDALDLSGLCIREDVLAWKEDLVAARRYLHACVSFSFSFSC